MSSDSTRDVVAFMRERVVPAGGTRYGLVIGIEKYKDARLNLRYACADARAIYDLMVASDCGMFPKDNVRLLLDDEATKDNVWKALSGLRRNAGENDTVWIYYAGHAAPEESNIYWVTYDADVDDLYATGIPSSQISQVLCDIRAKRQLLFLDCCHAAAAAVQKNPTRAVLTPEEVFKGYRGEGRVIISASDGKEKSVELSDVGHGAFTYFLEKGLRGEADADNEGVITADKLWAYLDKRVSDASQRAGNPQTPVLEGKLQHGLALTLNPMTIEDKRHIAEVIVSYMGIGEGHLATEEVDFCLELMRRSARTDIEREIKAEFECLAESNPKIKMFKRVIRTAMEQEGGRSKGESSAPAKKIEKEAANIKTASRKVADNPENKTLTQTQHKSFVVCGHCNGTGTCRNDEASSLRGGKRIACVVCWEDAGQRSDSLRQPITCTVCKGKGSKYIEGQTIVDCPHCHGSGTCKDDTASFLRGKTSIACIPCWAAAGRRSDSLRRPIPCRICGGLGKVNIAEGASLPKKKDRSNPFTF